MSMKEEKLKEAAKLNQLKYVFDDTLDNAKINELKTIGIGNFIDGANWAIDKACEYLRREYEDIGIRYVRGVNVEEEIEELMKFLGE